MKVDLSGTILASGTGLRLVCQATPTNNSTLYPNMEDYEGPIGVSPPTAYLCKPWDIRQTKDNL